MLTNKQIDGLPTELLKLYGDFEQSVINDIARRLKKENRWTETAELQAKMLQDLGYSPSEIRSKVLKQVRADKEYQKYVAENTLEYKREVQEKINETLKQAEELGIVTADEAANMSYNNDLALWSEAGKDLAKTNFNPITAEYSKALNSELKNLTKSTAFRGIAGYMSTQTAFNKQLDLALMKTVSGTFSYQQAVNDVVKNMADGGMKVLYKSEKGRITARNIDSAVRTAVLTASNRVTGAVSMQNLINSGEDLVEVSSHGGARHDGTHGPSDHAYWQGKVYSVSNREHPEESKRLGYPIRNLEQATGYPNDPSGLMGYNCRHTFYTFFEGISEPNPMAKEKEPVTINGKTYTEYEATQVQRKMERNIRATKRNISAKEAMGEDIKNDSVRLNSQMRQYKAFSNKAGLRVENNRLGTYGYTRSTAGKVSKVSNSRVKNMAKPIDSFQISDLPYNSKIWPDKVVNELLSSEVGKSALEYLEKNNLKVTLTYAKQSHSDRGYQQGDRIRLFMANNANEKVAACTVIHEVTHHKYNIGNCQWAEAVCMAHEKMHIEGRTKLTFAEKRYIVGLVKEHYGKLNWKKGGYRYGKKF